ncbi:putative disease resistance RPP13-like protein 3 [Ziziphus jujuba]|uniref:Disease resistance RPP13-like protein 3 n=1 Tax=Ziziphus jujuba TaxID=326968 RepID=A0ABM3I6Q2_ZIZJJ|nr:putative disease resistance RPP13-like protein 3 [Ziziphus jujuba]
MAENVVSFLLDNLARYLTQEVDLLHGFEDEVKMLQNDLTMIDAFLKDSEAEQNENDEVQEVVEQIRDVGREAEDVVDTCVANLIMQRRKKSLSKLLNRFSHASMLRHVVEKIKSLQKTITQIYDNTDRYGIRQIHPSPLISDTEQIPLQRRRWENVEEYDDDDHVVGFEQDATTLVKYLTDGDSGRHVVSLFGMGGLGKTTLAEKIYNDSRIKNHFDCQAWGYVSQQYRGKDLFYGMLKCLTPISYEMRKMSEDELKNTLRAFLREKRYFIVMDDIWKLDVWNEVRQVLPDSFNGSRILITTRVKDVAMYSSQTPPYALSFLDNKTSFQLFCRKVFGKQKCPSDLENLAMKLVKSCKGLPISIVVLGGLLANKRKNYETWSKLFGNINFNYSQQMRYLDILALSYNQLPRKLKSCFLYLSVFPIDYEIPARQLIKLWLAEGFIQKIDERKVEDVAEEYLMELIHRNLIQVASRRTDGGVKTCRIHDLIRDLSIFESAREKFLEIHSEDSLSSISKARRLSIQGNISEYISTDPRDPCHARSLVMFGEGNKFDMKHWRWIHKSLKFIRVLCLENMHVDSIPKEIGKLIFLRYLRIWSETLVRIHSIPSSICKLQYLETIGINGHVEECLPMGFWKMKQLRHLKISGGIRFPSTPAPFDDILLNLQVLSYLLVDEKTTHLNALSGVPNVRKLHLKYDVSKPMNEFEVAELLESLENLKQLQKLKLFDIPKSEPRSNLFPPTLIKLTFIRSYLNSAHFRILGKLPNLQFLKIKGKFLGFNILHPLCCVAGEFPSLQVFQMIGLEIEKWEMEGGSMPKLDRLVIFECYKLRNLPEELWSSTPLRLVEVSRMSESFMKMIKELKMKDGCKILIDSNPQNI